MSVLRCELCPTECVLKDYEVGGCRVRINKGGELFSLVYGKPCSVHVDPIEKKPFFHFYPGSRAFSVATVGCVLGCKFCQNWEISQARPEESDYRDFQPDDLVRGALSTGCKTITYTYTEPTVFYEYMYDTAVVARSHGLTNSMHTCGYINEAPLRELCKYMDAADVDLKAFTGDFYERVCGGRLQPVLDAIVILREEDVWLEITNLVIPTLNDSMQEVREMSKWLVKNAGEDTPLHLSRFFPYYKLKNLPPTPVETLTRARAEAMDAGLRYVYIGNVRTDAEHTYCPRCGKVVIERAGYWVRAKRVQDGRCAFCQAPIAGVGL